MTDRVSSAALPLRRPPLWRLLIRHEWRLTIRDFTGRTMGRGSSAKPRKPIGRKRSIFTFTALFVFMHALGSFTLVLPRHWSDSPAQRLVAMLVMLLLFTLMLSMAMSRVVSAFHERRDLDLMLAAPIAPMLILCIRAITVVAAVTMMFAIFIYPIANVAVASGRWWMARLYPLLPLMALTATAIGLMLTGALVRLIGVRRARVGLQIFSALFGASIYLISQAQHLLPRGAADRWTSWLARTAMSDDSPWPLAFTIRIAAGEPLAWLAFVVGSVALFVSALWLSRRRFSEVAQTPEADARVLTPARAAVERRIAHGFARGLFIRLLHKEWRLILRAPQLLSQILLQLLYLLPLVFLSFGRGASAMALGSAALVAASVALTGTLAASLAWLTVSGEDAPDLLAASPLAPLSLLTAKLLAAVLPPLALAWLVGIGIARSDAAAGLVIAVYATLACVSAALIATANPLPGKRSDFQRRSRGNVFIAIVEQLGYLTWAAAAGIAVHGPLVWCVALTALALLFPALMAWRLRTRLAAGNGLPIGAG